MGAWRRLEIPARFSDVDLSVHCVRAGDCCERLAAAGACVATGRAGRGGDYAAGSVRGVGDRICAAERMTLAGINRHEV